MQFLKIVAERCWYLKSTKTNTVFMVLPPKCMNMQCKSVSFIIAEEKKNKAKMTSEWQGNTKKWTHSRQEYIDQFSADITHRSLAAAHASWWQKKSSNLPLDSLSTVFFQRLLTAPLNVLYIHFWMNFEKKNYHQKGTTANFLRDILSLFNFFFFI